MSKREIDTWYKWYRQRANGYHLSESDKKELISLNDSLLVIVQEIKVKENLL